MPNNRYAVNRHGLSESSDSTCRVIAEQCAIVLCKIARDRGDDDYQILLEIKAEGPVSELWQIGVRRVDNQMLQ